MLVIGEFLLDVGRIKFGILRIQSVSGLKQYTELKETRDRIPKITFDFEIKHLTYQNGS